MIRWLVPTLSLVLAVPAVAQVRPVPFGPDPHLQRLDYAPDRVFAIDAVPGYQITISLAPDERIETVALGNAVARQVTANKGGNSLYIKALRAGEATNMTVATNVRRYAFELTASSNSPASAAYTITFQYPRPGTMPSLPQSTVGMYTLHGDKKLWPDRISDDGRHIFIEWAEDVDLPAVYIVDGQGRETLSNGAMRDGRMVIDTIASRLVFRIDRHAASARRYLAAK